MITSIHWKKLTDCINYYRSAHDLKDNDKENNDAYAFESTGKKSLVSRRAEMFGGLAKNNSLTTRSRHLSETNLRNVQPEKITQNNKPPHHPNVDIITSKASTNSKNSAMLSLPPQINSPLTTFLWLNSEIWIHICCNIIFCIGY